MNSQSGRSGRKDQGPQGTQVFSREEVSRIVGEAATEEGSHTRAELTGVSAEISGQSFPLGSARVVVGRASNCDIRFDDSSVSSEHARLTHDAAGWRVVNLLSTNGTFVNDQKVSSQALKDGDRIRFGRVELRFHGPDAAAGGGASWLPWAIAAGAVAVAIAAALWIF
ncbi:MAG: FHA domain-containing protein [Gammaproteobacteria bacterium]|jgi:hypothetical protein|nr:FHA domain-containing protein [Gammaproteobacteria bacterium]